MFCINCGKQIVDTARFCNYCGTKVVNFDEKNVQSLAEIPENPLSIPVEDVKIPENVENSVDLLKMQNDNSSAVSQMNESSDDSDTPFSENETPSSDIQSGAIGAQRSADAALVTEPSDAQYDTDIEQSEPIGTPLEQSTQTGAIPGQIPPIGMTSGQSAPESQTLGQPEQPKQTERRYTIGHIIMCLASTALMAIAAGVFAGLYFSVV